MCRFIPILPLLAALFLLGACSAADQPPFTAEEADKFIADTPAITESVKQGLLTLGIQDMREAQRELTRIKEAKIVELGWELDRYQYLFERFSTAISCVWLQQRIENLEAGLSGAYSPSQKVEMRQRIKDSEANLASLRIRIEKITTVPERVFLDERLPRLAKLFEGEIDTYQSLR